MSFFSIYASVRWLHICYLSHACEETETTRKYIVKCNEYCISQISQILFSNYIYIFHYTCGTFITYFIFTLNRIQNTGMIYYFEIHTNSIGMYSNGGFLQRGEDVVSFQFPFFQIAPISISKL